ncbi:MAG: carboxypeptidase-like regulatory domain-containing protein [Paludibacter sp.]|nr:carboxypeptidase-like regulatory domain-containing protein [Paludibacter sp.]
MNVSKQRLAFIPLMLLAMTQQLVLSQTKGVIADKATHQPIPYVSVYTKSGDNVFGEMSNEQGQFTVDFPFQTLFFSHINYQKIELTKENLRDTVFLTPTSVLISEIVVRSSEPTWIPRILNEVVKQKNKNYQNTEKQFAYNYESYTLGDSSGYAFKSKGNLLVPKLSGNPQYYIDARNNIIKYKDKTAGVDFTNLKTMLYADFMTYFNAKFIKNNTFKQNPLFQSSSPYLVQLRFNDKKDLANEGYVVIDTLNKVVVESAHNTDTGYNIKNNTTLFSKVMSPKLGIKYTLWITKSHTKYSKQGGSYYIAESTYKFSLRKTIKNKKTDAQYFTTIESKVSLNNQPVKTTKMIALIKPFNAITFYTKKMQSNEAALNKVPVSSEKF